jgi:hypothetical protein
MWTHRLFANRKRWGLVFTTGCVRPTSSPLSAPLQWAAGFKHAVHLSLAVLNQKFVLRGRTFLLMEVASGNQIEDKLFSHLAN